MRVVLSHLGYPVKGDGRYGGGEGSMWLHCYEVGFEGEEGGRVKFRYEREGYGEEVEVDGWEEWKNMDL